MQRKIIYFINPISGTKNKGLVIEKIKERTKQQNIPFEILHTNAAGNYFYLKEKIDTEEITDIVICGGDGTINKIVNALLDVDVKVGIIPMGSGNGLALAAKIPRQIDKALDVIFTGKASYIDSFFINDSFSCMLCGLGFDAQVAHDFASQQSRGLSTYVKQTINNFLIAQPYLFEITNVGNSFTTEAYFISIANSNQFGNNFTIAPKASLSDGLLDVVVVKKMSKFRLLLSILKHISRGEISEYNDKTFHDKDVLYFQTDKLIIRNLDRAPLHIDGDPATTAGKFSFEIIPDAFKLIQPA
ncbi:YegS/Rv2252/BmrU family lipid kinase [Ferruginibacter lapsinanis]|uniref:diacylglycerol/lipid kinase family protein n=1 Tax=Ferruginibacter lapsinanis TaxID=563172 RepID=UPI001E5AE7B4|nr:YegS/Rv2252/BmrU family lipid kinase [Ferruginibacter lapsinanis]UEG50904.1 YegS/Rv2252/BmrU family lipid kinase [Ferruginibacter lapsinanis]